MLLTIGRQCHSWHGVHAGLSDVLEVHWDVPEEHTKPVNALEDETDTTSENPRQNNLIQENAGRGTLFDEAEKQLVWAWRKRQSEKEPLMLNRILLLINPVCSSPNLLVPLFCVFPLGRGYLSCRFSQIVQIPSAVCVWQGDILTVSSAVSPLGPFVNEATVSDKRVLLLWLCPVSAKELRPWTHRVVSPSAEKQLLRVFYTRPTVQMSSDDKCKPSHTDTKNNLGEKRENKRENKALSLLICSRNRR